MIYKEVLTAPEGTLVRSFTPPPLLCASRRLRDEALPLFYKHNHFEITVERRPSDIRWTPISSLSLPHAESRVWQRFLGNWRVFSVSGTNGLQYVERLTVVYELFGVKGYSFGSGRAYDRRLGFRFSRAPLEDVVEGQSEEVIRKNSVDSSSEGSDDGSGDGVLRRHAALLNRGTFDWTSRLETQRLLSNKIRENGKCQLHDHEKSPESSSSPAF